MHIITWTNTEGDKESVRLTAAEIDVVLRLCSALRADQISYSHVFED